ncbi:MAG TPA: 50S ribosomal protein L24 [Patescibacteria group bacterium]|nr:50S ribosomal protein L24 [Patescibacteria group bacterium]
MKKIKKGDKVKILLGKDSGREGSVDKVLGKTNQVVVSGVNIYKRSVKKMGETQGGIIDLVKPVDISNVVLVCPNCNKPSRVGFKVEKDSKIRICKKCGKEIK